MPNNNNNNSLLTPIYKAIECVKLFVLQKL